MISTGKAVFIDSINDPRWDRFVSRHPSGWLTHLSGWKQVIEGTFKQIKGYHIAVVDSHGGEIKACVPVFLVRNLLTGTRLVSVPLGTLCGPLTTAPEDHELLVDSLLHLSARLGASSVELRTHGDLRVLPEDKLHKSSYFMHHCLDLSPGPEELKKSFHRSCVRQKIDRAIKSGLKLRIGRSEKDLRKLYSLHVTMRKRQCLPPQPYKYCEMLWKTFHANGQVQLLLAEDGKNIPACLMLFKFNGRVSAEILAHDAEFRDKSPNHFLFWEAIKIACAERYRIFDFGRTSPDNESLMDFKGRWGTRVEAMPTYYYPKGLVFQERNATKSMSRLMVNKMFKRVPEGILKHLGQVYYNYFY